MDIGIVSMRYAKALMGYVQGTEAEEQAYKDVCSLARSFETCSDLRKALDNPVLPLQEKYSLLCKATAGEDSVGDAFSRFLSLVLKNHRTAFLQYICLGFMDLYRKRHHIGVAKLTTAVPVNESTKERIQRSASTVLHARMELSIEIDPAIEGGFIFDINDVRVDASIATQLKQVKKQFIDKNRRIV